jgi:hypothetical protein
MSNVKELITNVKDDDLVAAKKAFDALMSSKLMVLWMLRKSNWALQL